MIEAWLAGPVAGVERVLMPAAHALLQAKADVERVASDLNPAELRARPGGVASLGFHLRHIAGSIDRLLTYSHGKPLSEEQQRSLAAESVEDPKLGAADLVKLATQAIDRALVEIRAADPATLYDVRTVGRAALPTTVFGLLFHIAEHTQRHTGQIITTVKVVRGVDGAA